jgi:hypothetical protein
MIHLEADPLDERSSSRFRLQLRDGDDGFFRENLMQVKWAKGYRYGLTNRHSLWQLLRQCGDIIIILCPDRHSCPRSLSSRAWLQGTLSCHSPKRLPRVCSLKLRTLM